MAKMANRALKKYWKYPCPKKRFGYEETDEGWQIMDYQYSLCFMAKDGKYYQQVELMWFVRNYVRIHGDIDFRSFPYSLFQVLDYAGGEKPDVEMCAA